VEYHLPVSPFVTNTKFQATCFFFSSYAWLNAESIAGGVVDYDLAPTASLGEKALMTSITSVGVANLSTLRNSNSMRVAARHEYANALKWTNAALSDPVQAKEDTTLTAIICLSLFEVGIDPKILQSHADNRPPDYHMQEARIDGCLG
jgi:hypothetical protein